MTCLRPTTTYNDIQPGLTKVLSETVGSDVMRFVPGPNGIQAVWTGYWQSPVQDGLGSVRNNALLYSPFGVPDATVEGFAFTGEMRDANGLQYHRARYYSPELGVWPSLEPVEGIFKQPMSLNGYGYVHGNPVNWTDSTGEQCESWDVLMRGYSGECDPQNYNCSPDPYRKRHCLELQGMLEAGITPSFEEVFGCYACDTSISLLEAERNSAYARAMQNAVNDGMLGYEQFMQHIADMCVPELEVALGNERHFTFGIRGEVSAGLLTGVDINLEYHCTIAGRRFLGLSRKQCGWFVNLGEEVAFSAGGNANLGLLFGRISFPNPGDYTLTYTLGAGTERIVGPEADITVSKDFREFVIFRGVGLSPGAGLPPYVVVGGSIYLGPDLDAVPPEIWLRVRKIAEKITENVLRHNPIIGVQGTVE